MKHNTFFKTLVLALLVAGGGICNRAHAQYQSFFGDSITEYSIGTSMCTYVHDYDPEFFNIWSREYTFRTVNKILIDEISYYYFSYDDEQFYLREDTITGRLYRYDQERSQDVLICDMSLSVGDSFPLPYMERYGATSPIYMQVDTIQHINNKKYILFNEDGYNPIMASRRPFRLLFIEGIGPTYGPVGWTTAVWADCEGAAIECPGWYPFLLCVHKDGELVYMADERAGCVQYGPTKIEESAFETMKLYPNPTRRTINVGLVNMATGGEMYITDIWGRVLHREKINDSNVSINVKDYSAGVYCVTYILDNKKTTLKFLKK